MSPDLQFWQVLGTLAAAAVLLGLAVRAFRRARARRPRHDRHARWRPGEKKAFRWMRRLYPLVTAAEPDRTREEER